MQRHLREVYTDLNTKPLSSMSFDNTCVKEVACDMNVYGYSVYLLIFPVCVKQFLLQHGKCRTNLRWSGTMESYDKKRVLTELKFLPSCLLGPSKPGFMLLHVTGSDTNFVVPLTLLQKLPFCAQL